MPYMSRFLRTALHVADEMRKVTLAAFRNRPKIIVKGDQSPVTPADRGAEKVARKIISERHPDHGFFGEEFGRDEGFKLQWVIDPIDGTRSFATGCPTYGTLISLAVKGVSKVGVIDIPAMNERWFSAEGGTALYRSGRTATVQASCSTVKRLKDATVAGTSVLSAPRTVHPGIARILYGSKTHRLGGDAINYGLLASGHLDIVFDLEMKPYDFMAMVPIITAAGGCLTNWKGEQLTVRSGEKVIASATPALHREVLSILNGN